MKFLNTGFVTTGLGMPVKSGSLQFMQEAYKEALYASVRAIIGGGQYDFTKPYILFGCKNSGSGSTYNISNGAVFFDGEIYLTDAASFTISGTDVAIGVITVSQFYGTQADPVLFTDGVNRNVHDIIKIVWQAGASGTANSVNYESRIDMDYKPNGSIGEVKNWKIPSGVLADYFDGTGLGIHPLTTGWAIANGSNGTDDFGGRVLVGYKQGDSDFGTLGQTGGAKTHVLTSSEMPSHTHSITYSVGNQFAGSSTNPAVQAIGTGASTANTGSAGSGSAHNNLQPYRVALVIQRIS